MSWDERAVREWSAEIEYAGRGGAVNDFQLRNPENPDLCDISRSQWYTPPELAERIVEWALAHRIGKLGRTRVLEPSCGRGALVEPLLRMGCEVLGIDIDRNSVLYCQQTFQRAHFVVGDFTTMGGHYSCDRLELAVMNPPFENGQAEAHVMHAFKWAQRVVAHVPLTTLEGVKRKAILWDHVSLTRMVIHSRRPKYGGGRSGATAMCTIEVVPALQDGVRTDIEWW